MDQCAHIPHGKVHGTSVVYGPRDGLADGIPRDGLCNEAEAVIVFLVNAEGPLEMRNDRGSTMCVAECA